MSWQPILEGGLKDRASETVDGILEAVSPLGREPGLGPSLAGGTAGLALLHGDLAEAGHGIDQPAAAVRCLTRAAADVADNAVPASLYGGLAGGYEAWGPGANDELAWVPDPGLLTGAPGVALALLAAITPIEPAWDRALLVAIPPLQRYERTESLMVSSGGAPWGTGPVGCPFPDAVPH